MIILNSVCKSLFDYILLYIMILLYFYIMIAFEAFSGR